MKKKRTLYECAHARVNGKRIYCRKGFPLSDKAANGGIDIIRLARGEPLALEICQACSCFVRLGPLIPQEERGWIKKKGVRQ
ncbi:MAG: hypothetical protein P3T54_01305 [Dehalogenimonas sp.]|uniref:Uncharacterized protein n=1 Tax=Candidatus Dehalogenimonas loeffleri TaxID=3127115 RepID=A0ABZ2J7G7_9CHLR|nr:hypothetical protein [Dehalogenimonas sp.]